jgi:uncharacterized protein (TIGR04255 family)
MSPVEAMEKYVPDIQEHFRKAGFPEMQEGQIHNQIVLGGNIVSEDRSTQWAFVNKANTTSIQLNLDAITVHTTQYSRFEDLEETIKLAITTLHEIVAPSQVHRYGLRYVNVIPIGLGSGFDQWAQPSLLGCPNLPNAQRIGSFSETVMVTQSSSRLVARCITMHSGIPIPADLMPCSLKLPFAIPMNEPFVILDNDHARVGPEDFDPDIAAEAIASLHDLLELTFQTSVTPQALKTWK